MASTPLYKQLQQQPTAPGHSLDKFIIGPLQQHCTQLSGSINNLLQNRASSHVQLILGPNGNGKTLLNNFVKIVATRHNLSADSRNIKEASFDILFARITLNGIDISSIGLEIARNITRSTYEPPNLTYASIANKILHDFVDNYKPPLHVRLMTWLPRLALRKALDKYNEYLFDILTEGEVDPVQMTLDKASLVSG